MGQSDDADIYEYGESWLRQYDNDMELSKLLLLLRLLFHIWKAT